MPQTNKERRLIYLERQEKGLCPRCGKKKLKRERHSYCDECRGFFRDYNSDNTGELNQIKRTRYEQRKENRQCPRCGKKHGVRYTKVMCKKCLDKIKSYIVSDEVKLARKKVIELRKKNRQCTRCGKKHGVRYTKVLCKNCIEKNKAYYKNN